MPPGVLDTVKGWCLFECGVKTSS